MNKLKQGYYYIFYKFYKMSEAAPSKWWSEWKAAIVIVALEIWLLISFIGYYNVIINRYFHLQRKSFFIAGAIIMAFNYYIFLYKETWREYVNEFDVLPKSVNSRGSWIVFGIVLFVICNLVFSFYLKSQIDWSQYR